MGGEITQLQFSEDDEQLFRSQLEKEMRFLRRLFSEEKFDSHTRKLGYELECCLIDQQGRPSPFNQQVMDDANNPLLTYELARFNLEINGRAFVLDNRVIHSLEQDMQSLFTIVDDSARRYHQQAGLFGVLPSLRMEHLELDDYMSNMARYQLLNDRLMSLRERPVQLDIQGMDHIHVAKQDVMLEALGTSLQIHYQVPFEEAVDSYHASLWASIPLLATCANSPLVLQKYCWQESRIEIFKQAVDCRTRAEIQQGILPRVFLAKGYVESLLQLFEENLYFNAILPEVIERPVTDLHHLNLHNGTIWRWIRPIIGLDDSNEYHLRLELRTIPSGPTIVDTVANMVFFIGLIEGLKMNPQELTRLPYEELEKSFYLVARLGLSANVTWCHGGFSNIQHTIMKHALPLARQGLINCDLEHALPWLDTIKQRVECGQTGASWITQYWNKNSDTDSLVVDYLKNAGANVPVHEWPRP